MSELENKLICQVEIYGKKCGKECNGFKGLTSHIVQNHKIFKKDYYNKYLKKDNVGGKCLYCGKNTIFINLKIGYRKYCLNKCLPEIKLKCEICKKEFNNFIGLSIHISTIHKIKSKDYYNKYLRKDNNEGICLTCGKKTNLLDLRRGYRKFCSPKCSTLNKITQEKMEKKNLERRGVKNASQSDKVKNKIIKTNLERRGVECQFQCKKVQKLIKQTMFKKYGVDNIFKDINYIKECMFKKYGVDSYSKTHKFRELARLNKKQQREFQLKNGQELDIKEGKNERSIGDELLSYTDEIFLRKQWLGGLQPDLIGKIVSAIVEIDEAYHFQSKWAKDHDKIKNEYYILKGYTPIHIKESDWFEDKELQIIKFQETIRFLEQVKQLNQYQIQSSEILELTDEDIMK